jgi:acyl-coenzyme A synthetase/AMP-(fatty) acid ligase
LVAEPELLDNVLAAAKSTGIPLSRVWILDSLGQKIPSGFKSYKGLLTHGEEDWVRFDDRKTADETTAALLFSSGTTGMSVERLNVILSH